MLKSVNATQYNYFYSAEEQATITSESKRTGLQQTVNSSH